MCVPVIIPHPVPTVPDTHAALAMQAHDLQGLYNVQSEKIDDALVYDCPVYGQDGTCLSAGTNYTGASGSSASAYAAQIGAGYELFPHVRVGLLISQDVYNDEDSGIARRDRMPLFAVSGSWTEYRDGTGLAAHLAAGYEHSDLDLTRPIVASSQPGIGRTSLNTGGASALLSYGVPFDSFSLVIGPYAGIRYTDITRGAYTEQSSVSEPLTLSDSKDGATSLLAGLQVKKKITRRISLMGSAGMEYDVARTSADFGATGVGTGISTTMDANHRRFRGVAMLGGSFETVPGQAIAAGIGFRQESFDGTNSVAATVSYNIGF